MFVLSNFGIPPSTCVLKSCKQCFQRKPSKVSPKAKHMAKILVELDHGAKEPSELAAGACDSGPATLSYS